MKITLKTSENHSEVNENHSKKRVKIPPIEWISLFGVIFTHFGMIFIRFKSNFHSVRVVSTLFTLLKSNHFTLLHFRVCVETTLYRPKTHSLTKSIIYLWFAAMEFLYFFTNYKQDHWLEIFIKFDSLVSPTFEKIIDFSMHNVYWDTLYTERACTQKMNLSQS